MNNKLRIEEIRDVFGSKPFTSDDLYRFYQKYDPYLNMNTFRWRIYTLKKNEAIRTLKRGVYSAKNKSDFKSSVNKEIIDLFSIVHNQFPYIAMCIWETSWLNNLMVHQLFSSNIILEIDKDAASAVFAFLKEMYRDVYLNPGKHEVDHYINTGQNNIIVKNLTLTSPLRKFQHIIIPTIEKIMVDLFVDDELFVAYQGAELQNIYKELFVSYNINQSRLKQYAHKRHAKDKLISFLIEETNIDEDEILI